VNGVDPLTGSRSIQALPVQVMRSLDRDNIKLNNLFYYMKGRREADTYALLVAAIAQKPDAIIMTVNPFWVFNGYAIAQSETRFGTALNDRGFSFDHLIFSALLAYPRDTAFSLVGDSFQLIRDNLGYHRLVVKDLPSPAASSGKPDKLIDVYFKYPLDFWLDMGGKWHGDRVRKLMRVSNPDGTYWNQYFLRQSLERLAESGIPAYIYLAPTNPELMTNQADADSYLAVMNGMQKYFANSAPNIKFDLRLPTEITASMRFGDLYHYSDSGKLPDFLAAQIQNTLGDKIEKIPH